jgi:hypothetical protein
VDTKRLTHFDCRNGAPLDVVKVVCHRSKRVELGDTDCCEAFQRLPKCRSCAHFRPDAGTDLGTCGAVPGTPMTFPDLSAVTCTWYVASA